MIQIVSTTKFVKKIITTRMIGHFTQATMMLQRRHPELHGRGGKAPKDYRAF